MSRSSQRDPFAELFGDLGDRIADDGWHPDADVFETERQMVVRVELAGVRSDDLRVAVDGQELRISGVRRAPESSDVTRLHQMEIACGPFDRRVRIPVAFERERVSAHLSDGFLTVVLPKRVPVRRQVKVERA